jgi:hypothetical protein
MAYKSLASVFALIIGLFGSISSSLQSGQVPTDFEIVLDKNEAVIPCRCNLRKLNNDDDDPELQVSVVTRQAVPAPLTFRYSVTGGRIIGEGSVVVWDYDGLAPGEYQITVKITDASDSTAAKIISKKIKVLESPVCDCPVSCPSLIIRSDKKTVKAGDKITFHLGTIGRSPRAESNRG